MPAPVKIIHLEDYRVDAELVERQLRKENFPFEVLWVSNKNDYKKALREFPADIILSDHSLPSFSSTEALKMLKELRISIPFILVTATISEEFAVSIMKEGASDYLLKDRLQRLPNAVLNALETFRTNKEKEAYHEEITRNEKRFRSLFDHNPMPMWVIDPLSFRFLYVNEAAIKHYGYNKKEFLSMTALDIRPEEEKERFLNTANFAQTGRLHTSSGDWIHRKKDGTLIYVEIKADTIVIDNKEARLILVNDITEKKRAEQRLRETNERLMFHLQNTPLGFIEWDNNMRVRSISKRAEEIFGWTEKEWMDTKKNGLSLIHEEDLTVAAHMAEQLINGEVNRNYMQNRNYTKDGRVIWCEWFNSVLKNPDGDVIATMSLVQDITDRKNAEIEKDKMSLDLIQRNRDLEQFAYIVSHNLRAPVANILGISKYLTQEPDAKEKEQLNNGLIVSVGRLDNVVKDLNYILQVRREANEKKEAVNFSELVNDIRISLDDQVKQTKSVILTDFSETDSILTLKAYLYSIFYNLISNSLKYRRQEVITTIEIKSYKLSNKIGLIFKDNGMGIDMETKGEQVFGLYKRFHTEMQGKGMGLFMVKTQVEAIGGKISLRSEVNKGSEFRIELII